MSNCESDYSREGWVNPDLPIWRQTPSAGNPDSPDLSLVAVRSWPMNYFYYDDDGNLLSKESSRKMNFKIKNPKYIDFNEEIKIVQSSVKRASDEDIQNSFNWNIVPSIEWQPIINRLFFLYNVKGPEMIRIYSNIDKLINDIFIIVFNYKIKWQVPRPNQLDLELKTMICTNNFPSYPSGHCTIASGIAVMLTTLFPKEKSKLDELVYSTMRARIFGGVHYEADCTNGIKLGKQISKYVSTKISFERDENGEKIDSNFETPTNVFTLRPNNISDTGMYTCLTKINRRAFKYNKKIRSHWIKN